MTPTRVHLSSRPGEILLRVESLDRLIPPGTTRSREKRDEDDYVQLDNEGRASLFRGLAVFTVNRDVSVVLDHGVQHGSTLSIHLRGREQYGRLRRLHGRSKQRAGFFVAVHQAHYAVDQSTVRQARYPD